MLLRFRLQQTHPQVAEADHGAWGAVARADANAFRRGAGGSSRLFPAVYRLAIEGDIDLSIPEDNAEGIVISDLHAVLVPSSVMKVGGDAHPSVVADRLEGNVVLAAGAGGIHDYDEVGGTLVSERGPYDAASIDACLRLWLESLGRKVDPSRTPARQAAVGTYDLAGFPRYAIQTDGYPATMDVDGKVLVGYGASGDRFETWLSKPLPVVDSLLPDSIKAELKAKGYGSEPAQRASDANGFFLRGHVTGGQAVHTAADIPISAFSTGSDVWKEFVGVQKNTDVFFKLMRAALVPGDGGHHECDSRD